MEQLFFFLLFFKQGWFVTSTVWACNYCRSLWCSVVGKDGHGLGTPFFVCTFQIIMLIKALPAGAGHEWYTAYNASVHLRWKMWGKFKAGLLQNAPKSWLYTEIIALFKNASVKWLGDSIFKFWTRPPIRSLGIKNIFTTCMKKVFLR